MKETRVDFLDTAGAIIGSCGGPTRAGSCPYAAQDGTVPCQGRRIAPTDAGPEFWLVHVPPGSRHCPQAWALDVVGY